MKRSALSLLVPLLFVLVLPSCSSKTSDPELRRKAAAMPVLEQDEIGGRAYDIIEEVMGRSCSNTMGSNPQQESAESDMRIKAAELGADAVINSFCETKGMNMSCRSRIECRGDAIRWTSDTPG